MVKLREAAKKLTLTHLLLFLIAVSLLANWAELHAINANLDPVARSLGGIEMNLPD